MTIDMTTCLVRDSSLTTAPVDQDLVVLSLASNQYIALDAIGRRVWELLATPQRVEALCAQLGEEFDGAPEQIAADLVTFLDELMRARMVHVADAGT
jgi:hypothetical protein